MNETPMELAARQWFESQKLKVSRILEVPGQRRADYSVTEPGAEYVTECKDKDDPLFQKALLKEARQKGMAVGAAGVFRTNTLSSVFKDAEDQVASTPAAPGAFRIVWFSSTGPGGDFVADQATRTLFGSVDVIPWPDMHHHLDAKLCFYFGMNDFFRLRSLDAALVWNGKGIALCVNNYSPRYEAFKVSSLYRAFPNPMDPVEEARLGRAYLLDADIDRRDQSAAQKAVCAKYGWYGVSAIAEVQQTGISMV
ncbi:MAG: hypothetical protein K8T91_18435 [Planctomycetes bacterium]|nr:hypothetical protein [Planctomycetota bacterium]